MMGYGCTITVGVGVPIPILSEEILEYTTVTDADIKAAVIDYSTDYPNLISNIIAEVSYADLKSGKIEIKGKQIPTASLSSYPRALKIADTLKEWIKCGRFLLTEPVESLPGSESGLKTNSLKERPVIE
jgi:uncharacterized protein (DUF39 family)